MDEKIFDRVEKKYVITEENYKYLLRGIRKNMQRDEYYKSGVYNIYFDNDNFDLIIQSLDRPVFKEKLRARSYKGYDKVFFEIKTKIKGAAYDDILRDKEMVKDANLGYKRRVLITHKDYEDFVKGKADFVTVAARNVETPADAQIAKEIDYMIAHFDLRPKILVYYDRESYTGENNLRITFDKNLKYRTSDLKFRESARDKAYFEDDHNIIMEIKAKGGLPLWLVHGLSRRRIYPQQFSKIGNIFIKIGKEQNV